MLARDVLARDVPARRWGVLWDRANAAEKWKDTETAVLGVDTHHGAPVQLCWRAGA